MKSIDVSPLVASMNIQLNSRSNELRLAIEGLQDKMDQMFDSQLKQLHIGNAQRLSRPLTALEINHVLTDLSLVNTEIECVQTRVPNTAFTVTKKLLPESREENFLGSNEPNDLPKPKAAV